MISSLEKLCSIPAVIAISNFPEVKKQIFSFKNIDSLKEPNKYKYEKWINSLNKIIEKILKNYNPVLKDIIPCHLFHFIGFEMIRLAKLLESKYELDFKFTENFISNKIFSSKGMIEDCKAGRDLAGDNRLSLSLRFKIASFYFLEDILLDLWEKLLDDSASLEALIKCKSGSSTMLWLQYLNSKHKLSPAISDDFESFYGSLFFYIFENYNLDCIKFCFNKSKKFPIFNRVEDTYHLLHSCFVRMPDICEVDISLDILLSQDFKNYLLCLIFSLQQTENVNITHINVNDVFNFLKGLLLWPFQDLFIKHVDLFINYLGKTNYYLLFHKIVDLIECKYLKEYYDYRLLLKELWIKSPWEHRRYFLDVESGLEDFDFKLTRNSNVGEYYCGTILMKLFKLSKFTAEDEYNFMLILKNTDAMQKESMPVFCCNEFFFYDLIPISKLKLLNIFMENLFLNDSDRNVYKEEIVLRQITRVVTFVQDLDLADQIANWWSTDPKEIENLKTKIFSRESFQFCKVKKLFIDGESSLIYLNEVLKWFLHSDDKIIEWKKDGILHEYLCEDVCTSEVIDLKSSEMFFSWLVHSSDNITNIKQEIISEFFPFYIKNMFEQSLLTKYKVTILFLCSYDKELLAKFINDLNEFCTSYCEEDNSRLLVENSHKKAKLSPIVDGRPCVSSNKKCEEIVSCFSKELFDLLSKHENEME